MKNLRNQKGQSLVELLLTIGLAAIIIPALFTGIIASRSGKAQGIQREQATQLLKETENALKSIRNNNWDDIIKPDGNIYHTEISGNTTWTLADNATTTNGLTQQIIFYSVNRDTNTGEITTSGGTNDPSTKRALITISWTQPQTSSLTSTLYLTRTENLTREETTQAHFDAGEKTDVITTNDDDGEVTLGGGGQGNWCEPNLSITALDLPKNGVANAISAFAFEVVAGTGENSSGVSFAKIDVADTNPPTSQVTGTADGYKTNAVFTDGNYAYLGTDNNSKEIVILDLNNLNPITQEYQEIGYFDTRNSNGSNNTDNALSVTTSGNIGFITSGSRLYTFDLTSKTGSRPQIAIKSLPANGTKIKIIENDAFISIAGDAKELQIVHFNSNGDTLTNYGYADVNGQAAYDVAVGDTGNRAYLATGIDNNKDEFFIINTSEKSSSNPSLPNIPGGSYDANGMDPNAVALVGLSKAILVGTGGEEYQVINFSDETNPQPCGGMQVDSGINGIASVLEPDGDAYSYIITGDYSSELKIIEGGPGGQFTTSGTFESNPYKVDYPSAFNYFEAIVNQPPDTSIKMQVAVAPPNSDCANATYSYVGPNGNPTQFFEIDVSTSKITGTIPFGNYLSDTYQNPAQCFRYKAELSTSDSTQAPKLENIILNYSP